jgi:hypothetical protein
MISSTAYNKLVQNVNSMVNIIGNENIVATTPSTTAASTISVASQLRNVTTGVITPQQLKALDGSVEITLLDGLNLPTTHYYKIEQLIINYTNQTGQADVQYLNGSNLQMVMVQVPGTGVGIPLLSIPKANITTAFGGQVDAYTPTYVQAGVFAGDLVQSNCVLTLDNNIQFTQGNLSIFYTLYYSLITNGASN